MVLLWQQPQQSGISKRHSSEGWPRLTTNLSQILLVVGEGHNMYLNWCPVVEVEKAGAGITCVIYFYFSVNNFICIWNSCR